MLQGASNLWFPVVISALSVPQASDDLGRLVEENEQRRKQLANMRSPWFLETRIKELNLGLVLPQPNQVWRLTEPVRGAPAPPQASEYAARSQRAAAP